MKSKKGFVSISVIYALFLVFCLLLILILGNYINNRLNSKLLKSDIKISYHKALDKFGNCETSDNVCWPVLTNNITEEPTSFENIQKLCELNGNDQTATNKILYDQYKKDKGVVNNEEGIEIIKNYFSSKTVDLIKVEVEPGLYATDDDISKSYYFRGDTDKWVKSEVVDFHYSINQNSNIYNNDNWVKFGKDSSNRDMYWRILRINGDGSIRIMYIGHYYKSKIISNPIIEDNLSLYKGEFQYILDNAHGYGKCTTSGATSCTVGGDTVYNSYAKKYLENWWYNSKLNQYYENGIIVDSIFCNDRTTSEYSTGTLTYYGGYVRINNVNPQPSLKCSNPDDRFSENVLFSNNVKANGALLFPIGLISADELYLTSLNGIFLTMTPSYSQTSNGFTKYYTFGNIKGKINNNYDYADEDDISRYISYPVISISACVELKGSGTIADPYYIENLGD